ncbi:MAG: alpha/beta fold hydrolase [Neomegalonema sp.]|nr:alpha/beta fold hydrolase [Neomegalonema sp.]
MRLRCLSPRPMARIRLICLPFAGGGMAVFHPLARALPDWIEPHALQLPQREDLLDDPMPRLWRDLVKGAMSALAQRLPGPFALYGHSMGAELALALAQGCEAVGAGPSHLFLAARAAPGQAPTIDPDLTDERAVLQWLEGRFGRLPASLEHPEIRALVLPALMADLRLLRGLRAARIAVRAPLVLMRGSEDPSTQPDALAGWSAFSTQVPQMETVPGGHFFINEVPEIVADRIAARLV